MGERGNMTPPTHNAYTHTRLTEASPLCPLRIVKSDKYYEVRETKKPPLPYLYLLLSLLYHPHYHHYYLQKYGHLRQS